METAIKECSTEVHRSVVCFWWTKGLKAKEILKEIFTAYGGKYLSCKAVHNCFEKRGKHFADEVETETTVKRRVFPGFDALETRWDQCIIVCGGRMCREINVFIFRLESHVF
jgi:hypothetical protein